MAAKTTSSSRDVTRELAYLTRALKAPTLREAAGRLAERARTETWSYEEFLAACLQREVSARESHGGEGRIRAARFPSRKSLEDFDFDHARGLKRDLIAHLGTLDFVTAKDNVVFLGPPGTGKTHLAIGIAIRACQAGQSIFNCRQLVNFRLPLTIGCRLLLWGFEGHSAGCGLYLAVNDNAASFGGENSSESCRRTIGCHRTTD